ncbi:MAG: hypothetical protein ACQETB_05045 [Halobacteriota archaeon]
MHTTPPTPELPSLRSELYRLDAEADPRHVLATLAVDRALLDPGPVYWVDAHNHAATDPVLSVAPSPRILDRIRVARGFTPFQHYSIVEALRERVEVVSDTPALLVIPAIDALYREDVAGIDTRQLLARTLASLAAIRRAVDCPVLVTVTGDDELTAPIDAAATAHLRCERTAHGPRFVGEDFQTLVYPVGDGLVQTTIAYWQSVIDARDPIYASTTAGQTAAPSVG